MEIVSSDGFDLHQQQEEEEEEEEAGGGIKVLTTKLKELRFDQEEPGLGHSSSGLTKKLRLEFKMMTHIDLLKSLHLLYSPHESNGFRSLKSICVKLENLKFSDNLTNTCFFDVTKFEFCGDLNLVWFVHPPNCKDFEVNTAQHHHLSTSTNTKQSQTLRVLLSNELTVANAFKSGGSAALDIPCDLPNSENMDVECDMIRPEAGARACDLSNQRIEQNDYYSHRRVSNRCDLANQRIEDNDDSSHRGLSNRSSVISTVKSIIGCRNVLLLIATLFTTITFQVPFYFHSSISGTFQMNKQYFLFPNMFLFFNSVVFVASVVMTLFLLHEFPMKPWPQISVSALFGSYMCSIKAISPNGALALLFITITLSFLAAAGKLYGFARQFYVSNCGYV